MAVLPPFGDSYHQRAAGCDEGYSTGDFASRLRTEGVDMNWNIVEGNWKQFRGEVKARSGASSPTITSKSLPASVFSWRARFRKRTASRRTKPSTRSKASSYATTRTSCRSMSPDPRVPRGAPAAGAYIKGQHLMMRYKRLIPSLGPETEHAARGAASGAGKWSTLRPGERCRGAGSVADRPGGRCAMVSLQ